MKPNYKFINEQSVKAYEYVNNIKFEILYDKKGEELVKKALDALLDIFDYSNKKQEK